MKLAIFKFLFTALVLFVSQLGFAQPVSGNHQTLEFIDNIEIIRDHSAQEKIKPVNSAVIKQPSTTNTESFQTLQFKYGQILNVEIEAIENISLYQFVEEWSNTKYRMGGNSKSGTDCSGFAGVLYDANYHQLLPRTAREQHHVCDKVEMNQIKEGDLVFFNTRGGVSHVGVYLHNRYFVHASTREGVIISSLDEPYYKKTFISAGRIIPKID